jgi:acyl carrier protein
VDLVDDLASHIAREFLSDRGQKRLDPGADLTVLLDSVHIMLLARHVEETYRIRVADDEISIDNFESVEKLAEFVRRKRA